MITATETWMSVSVASFDSLTVLYKAFQYILSFLLFLHFKNIFPNIEITLYSLSIILQNNDIW